MPKPESTYNPGKVKSTLNNIQRVSVINEALPFIRGFNNKTFVIKYGGASMNNGHLKTKVAEDIALLNYVGVLPVVVHGGGPEIDSWLKKLDIERKFVDGVRVTDEQTIEIAEMVLTGKVQQDLVSLLNQAGANAVGLSGKDGQIIMAKPYSQNSQKHQQDWGFTGEIESVNLDLINALLEKSFLPVISSIAPDKGGQAFNINADSVASSLAAEMKAEKLILLTDTDGVLMDKDDPKSVISKITIKELKKLIKSKVIQGGMIPKIESAIMAIQAGVKSVHILNGTVEHVLLLETFTSTGVGTMITK